MQIIPAIDLWDGKVVRLKRGDPAFSTVYSDDPVAIAKKWQAQGAQLLHLVDLSAALGKGSNVEVVEQIVKEVDVKVEIGGGIRDIEKAKRYIDAGVDRVIIGTKGTSSKFLDSLIDSMGVEKIAVSVDVMKGFLAVEGWQKETTLKGIDFIEQLKDKGLKWIVYTDISRDGTLEGANLDMVKELAVFKDMNIIFSGGISTIEDLKRIKAETPFIWGVISGKALYEGKLDLVQALSICGAILGN